MAQLFGFEIVRKKEAEEKAQPDRLVTEPAIDSARVAEVAASDEQVSEEASASEDQPTTQGEQVSDTTVPAPAVETVEAPVAEVRGAVVCRS